MKPLGPKQARFVEEYLVDLNATQAAIRAGYASKNADVTGPRLLGNVGIASAVAHAQEKRSERLEITLDKWLRELAVIGFSDLANYIEIYEGGLIIAKEFAEMPENSSRALESIEENRTIKESSDGSDSNIINSKIRFKMYDKLGALEKIGKHLGFLKEKLEHSGPNGAPIPVQFLMPRPGEKSDKK
jgi:phage terminase small subunit